MVGPFDFYLFAFGSVLSLIVGDQLWLSLVQENYLSLLESQLQKTP